MAYNNNGYSTYHESQADRRSQQEQRPQVYVQVPKLHPNVVASQNLLSAQSNGIVQQPPHHNNAPSYRIDVPQRPESGPPNPSPLSINGHAPVKAVTQAPTTHSIPHTTGEELPIDYSLLLVDLAEDYFGAAYGRKSSDQHGDRENDHKVFCRLVAHGLACLEVVLREWRLSPAVEAAARLRYASVLFEETDNHMEAEEALSKGISHCEKYRLLDFRYNMQHLLARVVFGKNPKAAVRFLDGVIKDAETEQHVPWIYALRFLRVSLATRIAQTQELLVAVTQLRAIFKLASNRNDTAIAATASAIEALLHVSRVHNSENIEQAQRALVAARSLQLDTKARIPQIEIMTHFVDLSCSLFQDDLERTVAKMKSLQSTLDRLSNDPGWSQNGHFLVAIGPQSAQVMQAAGSAQGIICVDKIAQLCLQVKWLPKDDVYTLGCILSAAAVVHNNAQDRRAEKYLNEAMMHLKNAPPRASDHQGREILKCQIQTNLVFALCGRNAWGSAKRELMTLKDVASRLPTDTAPSIPLLILYLEGSIYQGTGDIVTALSTFSNPLLALKAPNDAAQTAIQRDLSILAGLNSVLIIHQPSHPNHSQLPALLTSLEALALSHQSRNVRAAYHLVRGISFDTQSEQTSIIKTKDNLQTVLQDAKRTANIQLMCIILNFMAERFFRGVVGEQPQKSARSGVSLARRGHNDLWTSVADGLLAEVLNTQGMGVEAQQARKEAEDIAGRLPIAMQRETNPLQRIQTPFSG